MQCQTLQGLDTFSTINHSLIQHTAGLRLMHLECEHKPANVAELPLSYGLFMYTEFILTAVLARVELAVCMRSKGVAKVSTNSCPLHSKG
jgi:hypothetical protein